MDNLTRLSCREKGCTRAPSYGYEGENAICCFSHQQPGMCLLPTQPATAPATAATTQRLSASQAAAPVKSKAKEQQQSPAKMCASQGCHQDAVFGEPNGEASYCREHKREGMANIKRGACIHKGCTRQPNYFERGAPKGAAGACYTHRKEGMEYAAPFD
ncbi:unnamed protein product [Chrysoparadoxa australica]